MDSANIPSTMDDFHLDILAQKPRINQLYTQVTFCFELGRNSASLQSNIINNLGEGIAHLSASFPWIAGKVVDESGIFKIKPFHIPLLVKDYRNDASLPSWEALQHANFPFSLLDESDVAPCKTLATFDASASELPVFMIQANFLTSGLLLTFNGQHGSMDTTGQSQVIYLFAKACRNEPFTSSGIVASLADTTPKPEQLDQKPRSTPDSANQPTEAWPACPDPTWAYFKFCALSLSRLKALATQTVLPHRFASTDDVLSAFVWKSITSARLPRLGPCSNLTSTLSRNVDMRRYISLPSTYPGFVTVSTEHTYEVDGLLQQPLGVVAGWSRAALDAESLRRTFRRQIAAAQESGSAVRAGSAGANNPALDVRLSSWAKEGCYEVDFGIGSGSGKADVIRRPRFKEGAREGLVYFLPKSRDGEVVVGACLREEDLARLKGDTEFCTFGRYVG